MGFFQSGTGTEFQSPIRRGRRCNLAPVAGRLAFGSRFSPLFVGAVVAIAAEWLILLPKAVSVPYSSGQALQYIKRNPCPSWGRFSPLFVGAGVAIPFSEAVLVARSRFSPLFVGAGVAIKFNILPHFC